MQVNGSGDGGRQVKLKFFSQAGQDRFVFETFFRGRRGGVFLDIGAYDGEKFSNSLFFERYLDWHGLCVEPLAAAHARLAATRSCLTAQVCLADFEGEADFVEAEAGIDEKMLSGLKGQFDARHVARLQSVQARQSVHKVPVMRLATLLERHALFEIDFCSIDTEGAELAILEDLDLQRYRIKVFSIENNYDDPRLVQLMTLKGYEFVAKLEQDYVFKRTEVAVLPVTTVICAVWHRDPLRWELLRGHAENVAKQTVPIEAIYVFDGADEPPSWLPGRKIAVHESLTVYQAWNVALSLVATPFVMNLNLDDRLAPDAIATLYGVFARTQAALVGGDWNICYSQTDTDAVESCYRAERLPYVETWPPPQGTLTRLGSGTGERGTFGPAVMWRLDAHIGVPRYPWRLGDGTLLKVAGDSVWWSLVKDHMHKKAVQVPLVIGNYHSHPESQAEFRHDLDEVALSQRVGLSLL